MLRENFVSQNLGMAQIRLIKHIWAHNRNVPLNVQMLSVLNEDEGAINIIL